MTREEETWHVLFQGEYYITRKKCHSSNLSKPCASTLYRKDPVSILLDFWQDPVPILCNVMLLGDFRDGANFLTAGFTVLKNLVTKPVEEQKMSLELYLASLVTLLGCHPGKLFVPENNVRIRVVFVDDFPPSFEKHNLQKSCPCWRYYSVEDMTMITVQSEWQI